MEIIRITTENAESIAPLTAAFRVQLKALKGIEAKPDIEAAREELAEYLKAGFPIYAAFDEGGFAGHIVCRIDEPCLWVEQIFVREDRRRRGVASMLFKKAEELAAGMGEETVYNFVHPNNERMIAFLRSKGYTVLNMIEIRRPYAGEKPETKINVGNEIFDY